VKAKDPDLELDFNVDSNLFFNWTCYNMATMKPCEDSRLFLLNMNRTDTI